MSELVTAEYVNGLLARIAKLEADIAFYESHMDIRPPLQEEDTTIADLLHEGEYD